MTWFQIWNSAQPASDLLTRVKSRDASASKKRYDIRSYFKDDDYHQDDNVDCFNNKRCVLFSSSLVWHKCPKLYILAQLLNISKSCLAAGSILAHHDVKSSCRSEQSTWTWWTTMWPLWLWRCWCQWWWWQRGWWWLFTRGVEIMCGCHRHSGKRPTCATTRTLRPSSS